MPGCSVRHDYFSVEGDIFASNAEYMAEVNFAESSFFIAFSAIEDNSSDLGEVYCGSGVEIHILT
jgi:hypothetical protein